MVLIHKWPFFQVLFPGNIGKKNAFYDILELKERLSRLKTQQVQKVEKLRSFQRG